MNSTERFEKVNINKLIPYARNARTHSKEQILQLRASLREFGFVNPVIVDKDYNIIAGHGRIIAAREEGITEIPCVFAEHLTDAQKRAYILADNRLALNAGWDDEMLSVEIADLQGMNFDISLLGFDDVEMNKLMDTAKDTKDDDFDVEGELKKPAVSRLGDVWILGRHRLICGDSTDSKTFDILLEGKKVNLVVTDPPYNVNYKSSAGSIINDNLPDNDFYIFLFSAYTNMAAVMADDASIYVFHADTEGLNFRKAFADAGFYLSGVCIWAKQSLVLGRSPYHWKHEPILFGWKKDGKHKWFADRKQSTIWNFDRPSKSELHPTTKPIALVAYPILNSSMTNGLVLDPFGGSGSVLIACEQTDRTCYMAELDEKYTDVIVERYYRYSLEYLKKEQPGDDIFVIRDGIKTAYADIEKGDAHD